MEIHSCSRTRCEAGISKRRAGQCSTECARRRLRRRKITELPAFQNTGYWIEILQPIPKNVQRWFRGGSSGGAVIHRTLSQSRVEPSLNAGDGALPVLPASYICAHAFKLPQISEIFESCRPFIFARIYIVFIFSRQGALAASYKFVNLHKMSQKSSHNIQ